MVDKDALAEARRLSEGLIASSELARMLFARIARELEVAVPIARALCLIEEPISMSDLATEYRCDKSFITPIADQMEALGFVRRVAGQDRRTKMLELTEHGTAVRNQLEEKIAQLSPAMTALTPEERKTLDALLAKISQGKADCPN